MTRGLREGRGESFGARRSEEAPAPGRMQPTEVPPPGARGSGDLGAPRAAQTPQGGPSPPAPAWAATRTSTSRPSGDARRAARGGAGGGARPPEAPLPEGREAVPASGGGLGDGGWAAGALFLAPRAAPLEDGLARTGSYGRAGPGG